MNPLINIHMHSAVLGPNPYMQMSSRSLAPKPIGMMHSGSNRSLHSELQPVPMDMTIERHAIFHKMLGSVKTMPLDVSIENAISEMLSCKCTVWIYNSAQQTLNAPATFKTVKTQIGILGTVFKTKKMLNVLRPSQNPAYDQLVDYPELSTLYIPLFNPDAEKSMYCIVQATRDTDALPFSDIDEENAVFFANKFHQVAHLLLIDTQASSNVVSTIKDGEINATIISGVVEKLTRSFRCKEVEFWQRDTINGTVYRYTTLGGFVEQKESIGAVETPLKSGAVLNVQDVSKCTNYSSDVDGAAGTQMLTAPLRIGNQMFTIVLRGKLGAKAFSNSEATQIMAITPAIARGMVGSGDDSIASSDFSLRLKALLEVAEILSGVLDIDSLIPTIMEKACSLLSTERCSLFLVDQNRQFLVSRFHGGLDKSIQIPVNRGIVGHTATTGEIVNINDAYSDPRFDKAIDMETGFKTKTLLTVPIHNNRGEIAGVTEMINRNDGSAFDEDDIKMMMAFNVFCGISLDNAKLYTTSLNLTRQLRGFAEMGSALNSAKETADILEEILSNAKTLINASRATIFLRDVDSGTLTEHLNIGEKVEYGDIFAREVVRLQKPKAFGRDDIAAILQKDGRETPEYLVSKSIRAKGSITKEASAILIDTRKSKDDLPEFHPLCCFPLITNDSRVLGVMELKCNWKVVTEDMKLLDCFAVFAAVLLEKSALEQVAKFGQISLNIQKWISDEEKTQYVIPERLRIPPEKSACIFTLNFDAPEWDGIGLFKVLWFIMDSYDLFREYEITNEMFFHFVSEISSTYNKVPYHNWRHACDVTQYVTYETRLAKMDQVLTKFELLALTIAAICHDANHDGFTNVFNEKAETPLGILFKNQSVMETHHCTVSIDILSKEECNVFHTLSPVDYKKMWTLIIQLILVTDMAKHFDFLKTLNAALDTGSFDLEDPNNRLMLMQAILKCGDISNVSRPFELADKWCDVLCEEFFRQGDLEMASGMEYTSPLNDREHLDKPKSQIGFYTFVCLPLYKVAARAMPPLQANVDSVESNLATWKAAAAAKEQAPPA